MDALTQDTVENLKNDLLRSQEALSVYACRDKDAVRRQKEDFDVFTPSFVRDARRIMDCPIFSRYGDKTQVFSLYRNDDITRRMQHVQIVSRLGRSIGRLLKLNEDLIEAIALGHDIGHTPFGHAGERFLSSLYKEHTGQCFSHNVQSVRFLDRILQLNLSIQTLDGILCHNGRAVSGQVSPEWFTGTPQEKLEAFDRKTALAAQTSCERNDLIPATLEGYVVRLADVLAYLGKDREDAQLLGIHIAQPFAENHLSAEEFIQDVTASLIGASYGKPWLCLDKDTAEAVALEKQRNYELIYARQNTEEPYPQLGEMFARMYERCRADLVSGSRDTPVFCHHVRKIRQDEGEVEDYLSDGPDLVVVDYIASMTDDYFIDFYEYLFPGTIQLEYRSYFSSAKISSKNFA